MRSACRRIATDLSTGGNHPLPYGSELFRMLDPGRVVFVGEARRRNRSAARPRFHRPPATGAGTAAAWASPGHRRACSARRQRTRGVPRSIACARFRAVRRTSSTDTDLRKGKAERLMFSLHPAAPSPSSTRPPETWSAVATIFASSAGGRNITGVTKVPRRRLDVLAANAAIVVQASWATLPTSSFCER